MFAKGYCCITSKTCVYLFNETLLVQLYGETTQNRVKTHVYKNESLCLNKESM